MTETIDQIRERATREAEEKFPDREWSISYRGSTQLSFHNERLFYVRGVIAEATRDRPLFDRMEEICKRRYRDGDAPYFRTFGMLDDDDLFLVRINRMPLHRAHTLIEALESAMKEWEESDDPNDQLEPLPTSQPHEHRKTGP